MWGWITAILKGLLPFIFSGSHKTVVERSEGIHGLDQATVVGLHDIPKLAIVFALCFCLTGCVQSFFGRNTTETLVMVAVGGVVEIATDELIEVKIGKEEKKKNMAGAYVLPKDTYTELQKRYEKATSNACLEDQPYALVCDSQVQTGTIVICEPVVTCEIASGKKLRIITTTVNGNTVKSEKVLKGMIAVSKTTYETLKKYAK